MPGFKKMNQYAAGISRKLYEETPKAVFAAMVAGIVVNGGVSLETEDTEDSYILREWKLLHEQGIVPQPPPKL